MSGQSPIGSGNHHSADQLYIPIDRSRRVIGVSVNDMKARGSLNEDGTVEVVGVYTVDVRQSGSGQRSGSLTKQQTQFFHYVVDIDYPETSNRRLAIELTSARVLLAVEVIPQWQIVHSRKFFFQHEDGQNDCQEQILLHTQVQMNIRIQVTALVEECTMLRMRMERKVQVEPRILCEQPPVHDSDLQPMMSVTTGIADDLMTEDHQIADMSAAISKESDSPITASEVLTSTVTRPAKIPIVWTGQYQKPNLSAPLIYPGRDQMIQLPKRFMHMEFPPDYQPLTVHDHTKQPSQSECTLETEPIKPVKTKPFG